jgi:hypothetical protein
MDVAKIRIGVIGASGYTGADLVRLAARHPALDVAVLTAGSHAGKEMAQVFPHLGGLDLPPLVANEEADWRDVEAVFCGLPHGTSQEVISACRTTSGSSTCRPTSGCAMRMSMRGGTAGRTRRPTCRPRPSTASPSTIATTSPGPGSSPARDAIRPRC